MSRNSNYSSWRKLISAEMDEVDESWADVLGVAPADLDLDREFYSGFGSEQGRPFTLWTKERVYFPVCYDGAEWCRSVPRHPCAEATDHIGGG